MLRFLNARLPKSNRGDRFKKTVAFTGDGEIELSCEKENGPMRRIRSEKVIKWSEE